MENLSGHTAIELLKMSTDLSTKHEALKKEIIDDTFAIEMLEIGIVKKTDELQELEKNYVEIIEKVYS
jgi:hypothetical protein